MIEYPLFDGRYTVKLGLRGKVEVYSNMNHRKMKVYGKSKDGLRYVQLTAYKGGDSLPYRLEDIKDHVLNSRVLIAMSQDAVRECLDLAHPPILLFRDEDITALPHRLDQYSNKVFIEKLDGWEREYKRLDYVNTSDGFLKYVYKVTTKDLDTNRFETSRTCVFTDRNVVRFKDTTRIENEELEMILRMLQNERDSR